MDDGGVRSAVEALVGADVSVADHAELAAASRAVARLQAFVDHAKVQVARRGRRLAEEGDTSSAHTLIDEGRCTGSDVKHTNERDRVCGDLPDFEAVAGVGRFEAALIEQRMRTARVVRLLKPMTAPVSRSMTTVPTKCALPRSKMLTPPASPTHCSCLPSFESSEVIVKVPSIARAAEPTPGDAISFRP